MTLHTVIENVSIGMDVEIRVLKLSLIIIIIIIITRNALNMYNCTTKSFTIPYITIYKLHVMRHAARLTVLLVLH